MDQVPSKHWVTYIRRALIWIFWFGYLVFPIGSGAWFQNRLECVYPWSELVKSSLSAGAYAYVGFFVYGLSRSKDERAEIGDRGIGVGLFFGAMMGFVVWQKCF